jgi:hypothetical protein
MESSQSIVTANLYRLSKRVQKVSYSFKNLITLRLEDENRQLHLVISQLRSARRTSQETVDLALADKQNYILTIQQQETQIETLNQRLNDMSLSLQDLVHLKKEVAEFYDIRAEYELLQRKETENNRVRYELEGRIEVLRTEVKGYEQEAKLKKREIESLHRVMIEREKEIERERDRERDRERQLMEDKEKVWCGIRDRERNENEEKVKELHEIIQERDRSIEEEKILKRKMEIDMIAEKKRLQVMLQHALSQLQNSQNDSVDRILIKNLILRYFQQRRLTNFPVFLT